MDRNEFYIEVPWGRLAVVTYGHHDLPLVLFCHGRGDSADTFRLLIELLPPTYHYVTFDLPGCGYSDKFPVGNILTTFTFVPIFKMVADHYGDRPFVFIGHSMGVQIGWMYHVSCEIRRISKVVDIDNLTYHSVEVEKPTHGVQIEGGASFREWMNYYYMSFVTPDVYRKMNGEMDAGPSYTKEQAVALMMQKRHLKSAAAEVLLARNLRPDPKDSTKFKLILDQRMKLIARPPFTKNMQVELVKSYNVPTLLLAATYTNRRHFTPATSAILETYKRYAPYFRCVYIEGFHDLHADTPERLAPHIIEFLEKDLNECKPKNQSKL